MSLKKAFINKYFVNLVRNKKFELDDFYKRYEDIKNIKNNLSFYKYYPLNDSYTIGNILNSIIHFSNPSNFNDPFDSFMGISIESMIRTYFKNLIINNIKQNGKATEEQIQVLNLMFDKPNEGNLIDEFAKSGLLDVILNTENPNELSKEEIASLCFKYVLGNPSFLNVFNNNALNKENLTEELLKSNYVRKKLDDEIHKSVDINLFSTSNFMEEIEKFLIDYNISYDLTADKEKISLVKKNFFEILRGKIAEEFRMTCFSEKYDDILMWSHYGNKHNGICVEYDFMNCDPYLQMLLFPVIYDKVRPVLNEQQLVLEENEISYKEDSFIELISKSLLVKSNIWEYENEWRVILPAKILDDHDNYITPQIKKIYFGVNVTEEVINDIVSKIKKVHPTVQFVRLTMDDEKYSFVEKT